MTAALAQCGDVNPIQWLLENWNKLIESVVTLSTNFGREQSENTIGTISSSEATTALRMHNGDLWAAATECIRQRQKKVSDNYLYMEADIECFLQFLQNCNILLLSAQVSHTFFSEG